MLFRADKSRKQIINWWGFVVFFDSPGRDFASKNSGDTPQLGNVPGDTDHALVGLFISRSEHFNIFLREIKISLSKTWRK